MYDFIRVACISSETSVANTKANSTQILKKIDEASDYQADILIFPELCVTGYTCGDLFFQNSLIENTKNELKIITEHTKSKKVIVCVGAPICIQGQLYNCGITIHKGQIIGISVKSFIRYTEKKWFSSAFDLTANEIPSYLVIKDTNYTIPIGNNLIFNIGDKIKFAYEIGDDIFAPITPGTHHCLNGAELIVNSAAGVEMVTMHESRRDTIKEMSKKSVCAYAYVSSGANESTTDFVFSGHTIICEKGKILSENNKIADSDNIIISDIDIEKIKADRIKNDIFKNCAYNSDVKSIYIEYEGDFSGDGKYYALSPLPFIPMDKNERIKRCLDIFSIQVAGLKKRLSITNAKAVIGVSGGLDSTLALLVSSQAMKELNRPLTDVIGITMPGFGTSDRTHDNSLSLMKNLGITYKEISIKNACCVHFENIGHDINVHDLTYENSQARERTQILMDFAGKVGGMVIGTGDLSELALGWCTYNGDHMSMYAVNGGVPKTLIKWMVESLAQSNIFPLCSEVLTDITETPISPELLPPDTEGKIQQKTEELVGPYELHDFFIYYTLRYGFSPSKIYYLAKIAFKDIYDNDIILKWLKSFYKRFFTQQFKRSCMPDGIKIGSVSLSPRGDFNMPSDASYNIWISEVEKLS